MLRLCGAELREVPAVPYKDPEQLRARLASAWHRELGAFWANQWDNTANREGHYPAAPARRSGQQTSGKVDGFTCAIGTGGTLAGVVDILKEQERKIRIAVADPIGRGDVQLVQARRAQVRGLLDHRRHRPGPRDQEHRRRAGRRRLSDPGRRSAADHLRAAERRRACASAAPAASTSPARSASPRTSAPATPSSRSSPTRARATSRSSSTRRS